MKGHHHAAQSKQQPTTGGQVISSREPRVNDRIRAREVRLVSPDGGQIGIKSIEEARWLADNLGLDLVEVAADARPPVVRMMDYGKFKYDQSVKAREARKKQTRTVIKEVQFRPKIGDSDFEVKRKRVERFLGEGDKVKVTMRFRGREVTHPEIGMEILNRLIESVGDLALIETKARLEGRQMTMVLAPTRKALQGDESDDSADTESGDEASVDMESGDEESASAPREDQDNESTKPAANADDGDVPPPDAEDAE